MNFFFVPKPYNILFFCCFVLLADSPIFAQKITNITGKVVFNDGTPAPSAFIEMMKKDSSTSVAFRATDEQGVWAFATPDDSLLVKCRMMAHQTVWRWYFVTPTRQDTNPIVLLEATSLLPDVVIKAQTYGVLQNGDTLKFQLGAFATGTELTLGDILKKLPGIEYEDGIIKYQGKKIDKLLLQGKDILNDRHRESAQGIRFDRLESVHVINNYRDALGVSLGETSDKVAINIKIKEQFLGKASGATSAWGGYKNRYRAENNFFNVNDEVGTNAFLNMNNVNKSTLTVLDELAMIGGIEALADLPDVTSSIFSKYETLPKAANSDVSVTEGVLSVGYENQAADLFKWKATAYAVADKKQNESIFLRNYFSDQTNFGGVGRSGDEQASWGGSLSGIYKPSDNNLVKIYVGYSQHLARSRQTATGQWATQSVAMAQQNQLDAISLISSIKWVAQMPAHWKNKFNLSVYRTYADGFRRVSDLNTLFGLPLPTTSAAYNLQQNRQNADNRLSLKNELQKEIKNWNYKFITTYVINDEKLAISSPNFLQYPFSNANRYQTQLAGSDFQATYKHQLYAFSATVGWRHLMTRLDDQKNIQTFPTAQCSAEYNLSKLDVLRLTYSYQKKILPLADIRSGYEIQDARTLITGQYPADELIAAHNIGLYFRLVNYKGIYVFFSATHSRQGRQPIGFNEPISAQYFIQKRQTIPFKTLTSLHGSMVYPLPAWNLRITGAYQISHQQSFLARQNDLLANLQTTQTMSLNIASTWKKPVQCSFQSSLVSQTQSISLALNTYQMLNIGGSVDVVASPRLKLSHSFALLQTQNQSFNQSNLRNILNIGFNYSFNVAKSSLYLSLIGSNLLHLQPTQVVQNNFNDVFVETTIQQMMPGYVLLGVQWVF